MLMILNKKKRKKYPNLVGQLLESVISFIKKWTYREINPLKPVIRFENSFSTKTI